MTTWTTRVPMVDSEVNARLRPLKAAHWDDVEAIGRALDGLLGDLRGRASLVEHLADVAVLATDDSLTDEMRGRLLRRLWDVSPEHPPRGLMARLTAAREARAAAQQ